MAKLIPEAHERGRTMERPPEQFKIIEPMFSKQAGNFKISNFELMNAMF
jgi:hypothetical protein